MSSFGLEGRIFVDDAGILVNSAWSEVVLGFRGKERQCCVFPAVVYLEQTVS